MGAQKECVSLSLLSSYLLGLAQAKGWPISASTAERRGELELIDVNYAKILASPMAPEAKKSGLSECNSFTNTFNSKDSYQGLQGWFRQ